MVALRREEATRHLSKAEVRRLRGPTQHRVTETTGTDPDLRITTTTVTPTRTAAPRRAGGTLPPGQAATEAQSTGPVVRRERSVIRAVFSVIDVTDSGERVPAEVVSPFRDLGVYHGLPEPREACPHGVPVHGWAIPYILPILIISQMGLRFFKNNDHF